MDIPDGKNISTKLHHLINNYIAIWSNKVFGSHKIHSTPYHPQAHGTIAPIHRQLKSVIMTNNNKYWFHSLSIMFLGLRTSVKEDLKSLSAELVYGQSLKIQGNTDPILRELRDHFAHAR